MKRLSELLEGHHEDVSSAVPSAAGTSTAVPSTAGSSTAKEEVSNIFGEDDETFEDMVQRHRFSWNDINPADYIGYAFLHEINEF